MRSEQPPDKALSVEVIRSQADGACRSVDVTESTIVPRDPEIDAGPQKQRIALVCAESSGVVDGIHDYTIQLADALGHVEGVSASVLGREAFGAPLDAYDSLVLQYNPFMWGRWGFAPWLPAAVLRARRKRSALVVGLMVHEPYVPMVNWRWTLMGLWQRSQLLALHTLADVVFASIEAWASRLDRLQPRKPTYHLPVGSNLPDMRLRRREARARLGATDETVVVATFGTAHPARQLDYVVASANAVADTGAPTIVQNLGAGAPALPGIAPSVRVSEPGYQSAAALAKRLAATDVFLAPFIDGVSTRRSTVMAALQHGLPIVGTEGDLTDESLRTSGRALRLVPIERKDLFVAAVRRLASRPQEREAQRMAARKLYDERFDWAVIASELLGHLSTSEAVAPA
jgi:glycosyltransferase involved in cell wall biosynthesis